MKILLSAGEVSGDRIAARIAPHLGQFLDVSELAGCCGAGMREAGVRPLARSDVFSHAGWASVVRAAPKLAWKAWMYLRAVDRFGPDAALVVDAPGLHGPLVSRLRRRQVPLVWVAPAQLWAWKDRRPALLRGLRVHPLHRFELDALVHARADARWLGFPGGDAPSAQPHRDLLAIFPGSRPAWRNRHRELFLEAALRFSSPLRPVLVHPHPEAATECGVPCLSPAQALPRTALALSLPGTATLELARLGVPTLIAARPHRLDAFLAGRRLADGFKGLPNRILGTEVFPERFSCDLSSRDLASGLASLWRRREETRCALEPLEERLWAEDAERRLAISLAEIVRGG